MPRRKFHFHSDPKPPVVEPNDGTEEDEAPPLPEAEPEPEPEPEPAPAAAEPEPEPAPAAAADEPLPYIPQEINNPPYEPPPTPPTPVAGTNVPVSPDSENRDA